MVKRLWSGFEGAGRHRAHIASYEDPNDALSAVRGLRASGYHVADVHTPFAVHGMDEALGLPPTRLPWATFIGGATGCTIALTLQIWTHTVDWPVNVGGKTDLALPALIPIAFELTVLIAAFCTVGALLFRSRLFPWGASKIPATQPHGRVTDDRFVLVVIEGDGGFEMQDFRQMCAQYGKHEIVEGWGVS